MRASFALVRQRDSVWHNRLSSSVEITNREANEVMLIRLSDLTVDEIARWLKSKQNLTMEELEALHEDPRKTVAHLIKRWQDEKRCRAMESERLISLLALEHEYMRIGYSVIAGTDEAGRGPLAGPIVAAAVVLDPETRIVGVDDSKRISSKKREALFERLQSEALSIGVGIIDSQEIDSSGIGDTNRRAMEIAVEGLCVVPDLVLVDGSVVPDFGIPAKAVLQGDSRCYSIACASIIAKVTRDRIMEQLDGEYPQYGFRKHKGYGTKQHILAIRRFGLCPYHRVTFCSQFVSEGSKS